MSTQRKQYSAEFKARVALEALKGLKTVNELASTSGIHPTPIAPWTHRLQKEMPEIFSARRAPSGSRTRRRCKPNSTNKLGNSKGSWTG